MGLENLAEKIRKCQLCPLHKSRKNAVASEGSKNAQFLFVGEAPGYQEDLEGRPFCGAAGKFLDEMLKSINLRRKDVFITNIVKCRPPNNRDPLDSEINTCWPYLLEQIKIIKPKLIVCLGRLSMARFLPSVGTISNVHGRVFKKADQLYMTLYHPAAALHQNRLKSTIEADFRKIPQVLKKIKE